MLLRVITMDKAKEVLQRGYFLTSLAIVSAVLNFVLSKLLLNRIDLFSLIFWWFLAGFTAFLLLLPFTNYRSEDYRKILLFWRPLLVIAALAIVGIITWFYSIKTLGIAQTSFLKRVEPLFVLMLGIIFLQERLSYREKCGSVFMILGSVFIVLQKDIYMSLLVLLPILSALAYGLQSFIVKIYVQKIDIFLLTAIRTMLIMFVLIGFFLFGEHVSIPDAPTTAVLLFFGGVNGALAHKYFSYQASKYLAVSKVNVLLTFESFLTYLIAVVFFQELIVVNAIAGGLIIIVGTLLLLDKNLKF